MLLEPSYSVFVLLRSLEIEAFRRLFHGSFVSPYHIAEAAFKHRLYLRYPGPVFLHADGAYAATFALTYMEVQAGPDLAAENRAGIYLMAAGTQGPGLFEELQEAARMHYSAVGAEIFRAVLLQTPREVHPRIRLGGDAYPGVGLAVLEKDVIARLVLLYEIVLQQQRIRLAVNHAVLQIRYLAHQDAGFGVESLRRHEILRHPFVDILRLTHIDDIPRGVVIPVNSRGMRQKRYFIAYFQLLDKFGKDCIQAFAAEGVASLENLSVRAY